MESNHELHSIILAAGKGSRMKSNLPKVMHNVAGKPMLEILLNTVKSCNVANNIVIISQEDQKIISNNISAEKFTIQKERLGTAHAASIALSSLQEQSNNANSGALIILYGDTPFISKETILKLKQQIISGKAVSVIGFETDIANQYGRLILDDNDNLVKITEFKDANYQEKQVKLCNSGVMAINLAYARSFLDKVDNNNNNQEYYLTDVVEIALQDGFEVGYLQVGCDEVQGVNNKQDLARANKYFYKILANKYMSQGLTLLDPDNTYLSPDLEIGKDIIIEPNVTIKGKVKIADNVRINSYSYIDNAIIGEAVTIGPFARIRPNSVISSDAHIGNFVEIKNSTIGQSSKVNHLSYIGDSEIAEKVNIGAGTITCNYDGYNKYKTKIEKNSFIGSNSCLIAPLTIGSSSVVAAGSVITDDIPNNCVTIARTKQRNLTNAAKKYHAKKQGKKS